jgi:hypothetical protein
LVGCWCVGWCGGHGKIFADSGKTASAERPVPEPITNPEGANDVSETYNKIMCRTCGEVNDYINRSHYCIGNLHRLTSYMPNIGKITRNADPEYRKRFGSRAKKVLVSS